MIFWTRISGIFLDDIDPGVSMTQKAAIRRRRQYRNGFRHLARLGRPIYPGASNRSVKDAIAAEKAAAARASAIKAGKKK